MIRNKLFNNFLGHTDLKVISQRKENEVECYTNGLLLVCRAILSFKRLDTTWVSK